MKSPCPPALAKGGLGYFMIWEKTAVVKTLTKTSLGTVCAKKPVFDSDSRYKQTGKVLDRRDHARRSYARTSVIPCASSVAS